MYEKLEEVYKRYNEVGELMSDPKVISDQPKYQAFAREHAEKRPIIDAYLKWKELKDRANEAKSIIHDGGDKELTEMALMEIEEITPALEKLEQEIRLLLLPKDPYDDKNIYLEIRAGTGGDEASLFAANLLRMYTRYAEIVGYKTEIVDFSDTGVGGYKEIVLLVKGHGAYSKLKYEGGGHRVQRIPDTEASGRVHTSACTVAVIPEADEVDVVIDQKDIRIDVYRSGGAGGQHVNTTDSAVRITYIPSNIVVTCQDERSQIKNKEKAMKLLRAKILEEELNKRDAEIADARKSQVGSGDRSERIRTYNFPQNRLTDHRINMTVYSLDRVMDGEIGDILTAISEFDQTERLKVAGL